VRPGTLRFRLVGAAALATLAAVALLGVAVELLLSGQLHSSLDRTLRQRAGQVAQLSVSAPALLTVPGTLDAPLGGREVSVEVVDRRGRIVARSSSLGGRLLPGGALERAAIGQGRVGYRDARLGSEPIRLYVAPIADAGGPGGAALLGALAAALLTSRGLRPLRRLSAAARGIEATGDPGDRLPDPDTDDEVGELARTLNRMLAALDRARETERRFLADASHELRTPLTALRGNAAYIARHGADREALADLEADAARLGRLLDDLLALERAAGGEAPHDAVALEGVVDELARRAPDVDVAAREPVAVSGERDALERALENLLENARVHGPPDGRITVELRAAGGRARLSVADEGPGIAPAEAELAVRRFWRGSEARGRSGSGLGLAIVAAIAERHGGRLKIAGARFTLDLPALKRLSESRATVP
jgi:signal transduction histidine kinase